MFIFIFLLIVIVGALEIGSLKQDPENILYQISPNKTILEPDEEFVLTTEIENRGYLPISYLKLEEHFPENIQIRGCKSMGLTEGRGFRNYVTTLFLLPRQKVSREISVHLTQRGRHIFRGATLYTGDFFGLRENGFESLGRQEVVVLPAPCQSLELQNTLGGYIGDISTRRYILEDPILTLGFREYTGRESQKTISWPQTLVRGKMMVKKYDYTQDISVTVLLNVDDSSCTEEDIEAAYSVTRSCLEALEQKHVRYSFMTNATAAGNLGLWNRIADGLGQKHKFTILEGLGRATYHHTDSAENLFKKAESISFHAEAHIVITPDRSELITGLTKHLSAVTGSTVEVLYTKDYVNTENEEKEAI